MLALLNLILGLILSVALLTLMERKVMASIQRRQGPNKVGYSGLLQPFSDATKLINKESIFPLNSHFFLFLLTPLYSFLLALLVWLFLPLNHGISLLELDNIGILILICINELSIYGVLYSGWASNSKYAFLGSIRSTAQMISYSVNLSLLILIILFINSNTSPIALLYNQFPLPNFITLSP